MAAQATVVSRHAADPDQPFSLVPTMIEAHGLPEKTATSRQVQITLLDGSARPLPAVAPLGHGLRNLLRFPFQGRRAENQTGERLLGETLASWMQSNYWNHEQLSVLTRSCSEGRLSVSSKELEDLTRQKAINPRPRLFRALAAIHQAVAAHKPIGESEEIASYSVGDLVRFASVLSNDDSANKPSWWFALYCQEDWASERLALGFHKASRNDLSSRLSAHLRQQIVNSGKDPVSAGKASIRELFIDSHAKANLLHLWLMGMRELGPDEVHEVIHPVLHILRSHGSPIRTVKELLDTLHPQG